VPTIAELQPFVWPAVITLALVVVLLLLPPIKRVLDRLARDGGKITSRGIELPEGRSQQPVDRLPKVESVNWPDLLALPIVRSLADRIRDDADKQNIPKEERERLLTLMIARERLDKEHLLTHRIIFGSQISFLMEILPFGRVNIDQARHFFDRAVIEYPDIHKSSMFEDWLRFLVTRAFVKIENEFVVAETDNIQDFFGCLVRERLTHTKIG